MKNTKFFLSMAIVASLFFVSCSKDDDSNDNDGGNSGNDGCQTCAAYEIQGQNIPAVEVCELENGNASVLGVDTMTPFADYISTLEIVTTCE